MKLENMLKAVNAQQIIGDTNLEVNGIHMDSRMVKNGFMFVAVKGTQADGHNYISKAIENGARNSIIPAIVRAAYFTIAHTGTGRRWAIFRDFRRAVICPASTVIVIISCVISVPPLRFAPPPRS